MKQGFNDSYENRVRSNNMSYRSPLLSHFQVDATHEMQYNQGFWRTPPWSCDALGLYAPPYVTPEEKCSWGLGISIT